MLTEGIIGGGFDPLPSLEGVNSKDDIYALYDRHQPDMATQGEEELRRPALVLRPPDGGRGPGCPALEDPRHHRRRSYQRALPLPG